MSKEDQVVDTGLAGKKKNRFHLYFDDTGTRNLTLKALTAPKREDGLDCFGLGGILIKEDDIEGVIEKYKNFRAEHKITYPLHSYEIRGYRENFRWLKDPEKQKKFYPALDAFIMSLPIKVIACVIHKPGYVERYKEKHEQLWIMCKTAFTVLLERSSKYVDSQNGVMEIYFEGAGKDENKKIVQYMKDLKNKGPEFDKENSSKYSPFGPDDFKRICLGKPMRQTKNNALIQIADLVLYPVAKGRYDPGYYPYQRLRAENKLIDCHIDEDKIPSLGIKYSCFDDV